jgi:transposase
VDLRGEKDIEQLRRVALAQQVQIEQLIKALARKCKELEKLKGSGEELQQTLALIETLTEKAKTVADVASSGEPKDDRTRKARTQFGPTEQPKLPIVEQLFELDEPDRTCPSCGGELRPMGDQFETSEMIDAVDVSYRVIKVKQQKYVCRCGGCVETAPGPDRATPGSRYSLPFAIKVVVDKYCDHIPLARQERILARHGLDVTSQTLWDLINALGRRLETVDRALLARVLSQAVIGLDQTGWPRLDGKGGKPWQMWCLTAPGIVVHRIRDDKGADTFRALVGGYEGVIVCDALKTHEAGARGSPSISLAGCWAHVFRKFEEASPDHPEAQMAMKWIGELYAIDDKANGELTRKADLRSSESASVIATMKTWLWSQAVLKTLSIGQAAAYTVGNWDRLTRFLGDARIPLDNNATERAIRGPVVGRKNHYGSKSRRGTEVAATFYTLIETAKLQGVNPAEYLLAAVQAADRGEIVMPWDLRQPDA